MTKNTTDQVINTSDNRVVDAPCAVCKRVNRHKILASVDREGEIWSGQNSLQWENHHNLIQCGGCETVSYMTTSMSSDDWEFDDFDRPYVVESKAYYPSSNERRGLMRDAILLPSLIKRIYIETISALNNDEPVLAGIGLRALVETICKEKNAPGRNLEKNIDGLVGLGFLTSEGASTLHKIRTLGNKAAHEVIPHTPEQLNLALDVCEHILNGVYLLPAHVARTL